MFEKKGKKENLHRRAARKIVEAAHLRRAGDLPRGEAACREALAIDPENQAAALACLGALLNDQGRSEDAFAAYEESLTKQADQPLVYRALAAMCLAHGRPEEALTLASRARELAPGLASARIERAHALDQLERPKEAFDELRLAFRAAPREVENIAALTAFVARRGLSEDRFGRDAWRECETAVLDAFRARRTDGRQLAAAAGSVLCAKYGFEAHGVEGDGETQALLAADELFIRLLQECVNTNPTIELFCARLRREILSTHRGSEELPTPVARLAAALALQNHRNGYVVWADAEEEELLAGEETRLGERIRAAKSGAGGALRAALQLYAMYRPLASRGDADTLLELALGGAAGRLVLLTVREARELAAEAARMATFGDAAGEPPTARPDGTIFRWTHFAPPEPTSLAAYLRRRFPGCSPPRSSADGCDILVPHCGSGRDALATALRFPASRILAVDTHLHDLAYGARRARKLGVGNIEFAAWEAMVSCPGARRFHFIDARRSVADSASPPQSLEALANLLVPGGLLRLDVAGKARAETLRAAFEIGAAQAQGSLQLARRNIAHAGGEACDYLRRQENYYDSSNCLGLIAEAERGGSSAEELLALPSPFGLRLVGQFAPPELRRQYRAAHADDPHLKDLARYEEFMQGHPRRSGGFFRLLLRKDE